MMNKIDVLIINILTLLCFLALIAFQFMEATTLVDGIGGLF